MSRNLSWVVVLTGMIVMVFLFVAATGCLSSTGRDTGAPEAVWPFAPGSTLAPPVVTGADLTTLAPPPATTWQSAPTPTWQPAPVTPRESTSNHPTPTLTNKPSGTLSPSTVSGGSLSPLAALPAAEVTGTYRVIASYGDSFIGEVLITNSTSTGRHWTVELRFPANVGRLRAFWVESARQPAMDRSTTGYTFTSAVSISGRSSVPLRFHFDRTKASDAPPSCTVNGMACSTGSAH